MTSPILIFTFVKIMHCNGLNRFLLNLIRVLIFDEYFFKVWDVEHILEIVHPIEKMELKVTKVRNLINFLFIWV